MRKKILILISIILIVFILVSVFKNDILKVIYPKIYQEAVHIYGEKYNIDENLIFAVIKTESGFNKDAVSNKGATGLMQLMEETAKEVARENNIELDENNLKEELTKISININIGSKYLSDLIETYESIEVVLAAYNAGIGNVNSWIERGIIKADGSDAQNIPFKETNNYVRKVLRDYKIYQEIYK